MARTKWNRRLRRKRLRRTDSTNGRTIATSANRILFRSVTFLTTCPARKTSTTTAPGARMATTALSGTRRKSHQTGLLTATAIGATSLRGAGLGLITRLGALRRFTMAAGVTSAAGGAG